MSVKINDNVKLVLLASSIALVGFGWEPFMDYLTIKNTKKKIENIPSYVTEAENVQDKVSEVYADEIYTVDELYSLCGVMGENGFDYDGKKVVLTSSAGEMSRTTFLPS